MASLIYENVDDLISNNEKSIHDLNAKLGYWSPKILGSKYIDIKGDLKDQRDLLKTNMGKTGSYSFRGICKIDHFIYNVEIKNHYVNGKRFLKLHLKKDFFYNKDMLYEVIFDEKLSKSFPNITSVIARAYMVLSKGCRNGEDLLPIIVRIESLPSWTNNSTFKGVRIKSNPWEAIRLALIAKGEYYNSLGV